MEGPGIIALCFWRATRYDYRIIVAWFNREIFIIICHVQVVWICRWPYSICFWRGNQPTWLKNHVNVLYIFIKNKTNIWRFRLINSVRIRKLKSKEGRSCFISRVASGQLNQPKSSMPTYLIGFSTEVTNCIISWTINRVEPGEESFKTMLWWRSSKFESMLDSTFTVTD